MKMTTTEAEATATLLDSERLSSDLALFISNPSLTSSLTDGSLDLASYASVVETELAHLEKECIEIYESKASEILLLRGEIDTCDGVLASLQEMLLGFQADLGGLSGDIRALQDQSRTLGTKLKNRREGERGLRTFLEHVVVPPTLADVISRGAVDRTFLESVKELNRKFEYIHRPGKDDDACGMRPRDTLAGREMRGHIEKLRLRAVSRTRDYFLDTVGELRRPKTNVRMIQVNSLEKYSELMDFLSEAAPDVYGEIRVFYTESMSRTLHALFRTYHFQLAKLDAHVASRQDLIAIDDATLRDVFSTKVNMNKRGDAFFLGERASVLELPSNNTSQQSGAVLNAGVVGSSPPILIHVAMIENKKYPHEILFKCVMHHLMQATTSEYVFVRRFFKETGVEAFTHIFSRTLSLLLEQLENYLFNCFDCLELLLMIKLTHQNRRIMKARKITVLDNFFDRVTMLLWPQLKLVMDAQLRSIRTANAKKLGGVDLHAHYVSRRYAEFTCSILLILNKNKQHDHERNNLIETAKPTAGAGLDLKNNEPVSSNTSFNPDIADKLRGAQNIPSRGSAGDMLVNDLKLLMDETVLLLQQLADNEHKSHKSRIVFMINNLDQIICIFQERRVMGKEVTHFHDLLLQQRDKFVEEELLQNFSNMIVFVQQTEGHIARVASTKEKLEVNSIVVENLIRDFSASWKKGIESINKNVLSYFSNFRNGMEILKQCLTQLLLYYTRFQDIIRKVWRNKQPAFCKDLVATNVILAEIKKYALAI